MALSGHKDISMLKRYSHTQEEAKKAAIKKLGKNIVIDESISIDSHANEEFVSI